MTIINQSTKLVNYRTNEYPQYLRNLYSQNPNISFPENMDEDMAHKFGYAVVYETPKPKGDVVYEGYPRLNAESKYVQTWTVREYTEEERNDLLAIVRKEKETNFKSAVALCQWQGFYVEGSVELPPGGKKNIVTYKERMLYNGDTNNIIMVRELANANPEPTFLLATSDGDKELANAVVVAIAIATMQKSYELQRYERNQIAEMYKAKDINALNQVNLSLHKFTD